MENLDDHISTDPSILHGEPHFRGTRIPVTVVLDNLKAGNPPDEILVQYPTLTEEHIAAAVAYADAGDTDPARSPGDFRQLLEQARKAAAGAGLKRQEIEQTLAQVRETDQEAEAEEWDLTAEQRKELSKRLAEHLEDPGSAIPWEKVREQLTRRWDVADHLVLLC